MTLVFYTHLGCTQSFFIIPLNIGIHLGGPHRLVHYFFRTAWLFPIKSPTCHKFIRHSLRMFRSCWYPLAIKIDGYQWPGRGTSENCVRVFDIGRCWPLDSYPFEIQELSSEPQVSFVHSLREPNNLAKSVLWKMCLLKDDTDWTVSTISYSDKIF